MTTGRINQITIVRRGWPRAPGGTREISKLLGGHRSASAGSEQGRAPNAVVANPLSLSKFPRAPSAAQPLGE